MKPGHVILITIVAYVLWEIVAHTYLMVLPMPLWHFVSGGVGILLALLITLIAVRTIFAQERKLEEVLQLKDSLTQMLVYDLREPVMTTLSSLETVKICLGEKVPLETREAIAIAKDSNQSLLGMVDDLLSISNLEENALILDKSETDVTSIVQQAVDHITPMAAFSGTTISTEVAPDIPKVRMDDAKIHRVLINLLINAVKFSHSGGWVCLRAQWAGHRLILSVSDSGEGIPAEQQKDIFHKFFRIKAQKGDRTISFGLRLVYCRLIAEAHGGTIRLESEAGKGSTFIVEIPA